MIHRVYLVAPLLSLGALSTGCASTDCSATDNEDGTYTMSCPDGTEVTWADGADGEDGTDGGGGTALAGVLYGDYRAYNASDIAALQGVTHITGELIISTGSGVTAIELPNLVEIGERLSIGENPDLTTLDLSALETVGWSFQITSNNALTTLDGFDALTSVAASTEPAGLGIDISWNTALEDIDGLSAITTIRSDAYVNFQGNTELCQTDVDAFLTDLTDNHGWSGTPGTSGNDESCGD